VLAALEINIMPNIVVVGLRLVCLRCGTETHFSPPMGTEEVNEGQDICPSCAGTLSLISATS